MELDDNRKEVDAELTIDFTKRIAELSHHDLEQGRVSIQSLSDMRYGVEYDIQNAEEFPDEFDFKEYIVRFLYDFKHDEGGHPVFAKDLVAGSFDEYHKARALAVKVRDAVREERRRRTR